MSHASYAELNVGFVARASCMVFDPQAIPRISEAIDTLASQPFSPNHRKLKGTEHQYRVRVGDYRIIYEVVTDADVIIIHHIRHRSIAYRGLE